MTAHVLHNSGNNEWYTPQWLVDKVKYVLGDIDVDPASNEIAQQQIGAKVFYTKENSGLDKEWYGSVFMNPLYSSALIKPFCAKLNQEVKARRVDRFITLTNNATETAWFRDLAEVADAVCFLNKRVRFVSPDGKTPNALQGQVIAYRWGANPNNHDRFLEAFSGCGTILYT